MTSTADRIGAPEARPPSRGAPDLDEAQLEALAADFDVIRRREMADRGEADAAYIRREAVVAAAGRVIEAMEIGHNVLHGQYDWMRDPRFDSSTYEWNMTAPAEQWRHAHNVVHHVNANVAGVDRDLGYGVVRITDDEPWKPSHLGNPRRRRAQGHPPRRRRAQGHRPPPRVARSASAPAPRRCLSTPTRPGPSSKRAWRS